MPEPLRVALSVDALGPRMTGIGRYSFELARRLPDQLGAGNLSFFRGEHWIDEVQDLLQDGWRPARRPFWRRRYESWQRSRQREGLVVHAPNYFLPEWAERGVATIHDLSVFLYPETHPPARIKAFEKEFDRTLRQASLLITDSEAVKAELVAMFGLAPERIETVSLGIPQVRRDPDLLSLAGLDLDRGRYLLCISTFEPRKRIDRLVEAYVQLPISLRKQFPLVLAGGSGWRNDALNDMIEQASRDGTVRRVGFVPEELLEALYAGARAFVYPSRYEGFGLPVVEAMAHGVPCLIADTPCLVEVAQGAAGVVEPDDTVAFSTAIRKALDDEAWQRDASRAGLSVASSYSWDTCVARTAELYHKVSG
jgi:alpha-1,3-rhamnosyl/mannosyltransferase